MNHKGKRIYLAHTLLNQAIGLGQHREFIDDCVFQFRQFAIKDFEGWCDILLEALRPNRNQLLVAIIGDSVVWGQGIRNQDRFAAILEHRLNAVRPTRVLSLAQCGDSLLDNFVKYQQLLKYVKHVHFIVFGIVENDLMLNEKTKYDDTLF